MPYFGCVGAVLKTYISQATWTVGVVFSTVNPLFTSPSFGLGTALYDIDGTVGRMKLFERSRKNYKIEKTLFSCVN